MKRLRFRFLLILMLFLTFSSVITGWLSVTATQKVMDSALNERFELTMSAINNFLGAMGQSAGGWANRLSAQTELKQADYLNESDNVNRLLHQHTASQNTKLIIILDMQGKVVKDTCNGIYIGKSFKNLSVFKETLRTSSQHTYLDEIDGQLISLTSALITEQNSLKSPSGIILVGFPIDSKLLRQVKGGTELDISVINKQRMLASTINLSDAERANIQINTEEYRQITQHQKKTLSKSLLNTPYINTARSLASIEPTSTAYILLSYPQERFKASIDDIYQQIRLVFLGGTIVAIILVLWLSRGFLQSIRRISDGAEKITKGDFKSRILINTGDELQMLADTFNTMANTVESTNKALSRYSSDLEREVEVRTRDHRKEERARAASERKIKSIIDNVVVGLLTTDEHGIIESFNPAAEKMFGYSADEVLGQNVSILMPSPHSELHDEYIYNYLNHGEKSIVGRKLEVTGMRKDGTIFPHLLALSEMYILEQSPESSERVPCRHFIATMQDLTESKRTEDILRRAHKMKALGQLTGGIAHDFNNLLGIIIGNLDLLEDEVSDLGHTAKRQLNSALKASLRGSDLTKRLLAFSRRSTPDTSPLNINLVVEGMRNMIEKSLTASISVETIQSSNLWYADINPGELEDAIVNMAVNARDAMPEGGRFIIETQNITTDDTFIEQHPDISPGEYILLTVSDTGRGIPAEVMDRIFEPFFTTKPTGEGTGLGIPMIYGFVKRSSGHITLYSETGTGTTFKIYFPRSLRNCKTGVTDKVNVETSLNGHESILVVDDEEDLAIIAEDTLRKLGYTVFRAGNAPEALNVIAEQTQIDLLFSDVVMPGGMDGYALASEATKLKPNIKVLLASGFTNKFHANQHEDSKHGFLSKPYRRKDMAKKIREILDHGT